MYYINDSITFSTTKWLSQLLQTVEAIINSEVGWSWKIGKIQNSQKNKIAFQIFIASTYGE